jgi:hypothetical protein
MTESEGAGASAGGGEGPGAGRPDTERPGAGAGEPGAEREGGGGQGAAGGAERPGGAGEPSEEEIRAALEEQMRRIRVEDVLVQTAVTLVNLAGRRLGLAGERGEEEKDLEQARLAIEGTRALLPLLPGDVGPIRDALSQLQISYAREAGEAGAAPGPEAPGQEGAPTPREGAEQAEEGRAPAGEADRAKARSKIWTPPGA